MVAMVAVSIVAHQSPRDPAENAECGGGDDEQHGIRKKTDERHSVTLTGCFSA